MFKHTLGAQTGLEVELWRCPALSFCQLFPRTIFSSWISGCFWDPAIRRPRVCLQRCLIWTVAWIQTSHVKGHVKPPPPTSTHHPPAPTTHQHLPFLPSAPPAPPISHLRPHDLCGRNAREHEDGRGETRSCRLQAGSRFATALRLFNDEHNHEAVRLGQE